MVGGIKKSLPLLGIFVVILHFAKKRIGQERLGYPYATRAG
jgi:hypothetical protein